MPPARSGIADYSAELVPALAEQLRASGGDIELFVDEGLRVEEALTSRFTVRGDRAFPALWESGRYDAVLYHVGNNPDFHTRTWKMLQRIPGIVVLHEYMLHHLVRGMTLAKGDLDGYVEEMRYAYGRTGEALARRSVGTGIPLDVWSYPLFERVVDASLGLIVHNDCTGDRVRASRPGTRIVTIPHHLSLRELDAMSATTSITSPEQARAALGLPPDAFVVASFGFVTPAKRIDVALRAFARLKREVPTAVYLLVGEVSPHYDFASLLTPALAAGVTVVGHTELDRFLLYMLAADVTVNLRYPSAGETSGTLIRLLGLGKPVIVSNTGAFSEIPDDCCARIDLDDTEEELLAAVLLRLAADEPLRRRMGENARAHIAARHTLEGSARGYADFVREIVAARPEPFRAVPPLAPAPPEDVFSDLVAAVASEAADLGVGEDETELLGELAAVLAEWRTG
ncbi:MAG TPA: glycosyltransferase family 4 protein [Solirubrobacterales bacterium]|nr:glycosyltransferase family 4 protein [Solirubrobacterales bacterium]